MERIRKSFMKKTICEKGRASETCRRRLGRCSISGTENRTSKDKTVGIANI